jgi:hypothetical protein
VRLFIANAMKKQLVELDAKMQGNESGAKDSFEVQCQVLALLLNHKITAFHFPQELMKKENMAAATELCRSLIAQRPPDLHTLVSRSPCTDNFWNVGPLVNSMLGVLPNIEVLQIDGCLFGDEELRRIADQLPKLRFVNYKAFYPDEVCALKN